MKERPILFSGPMVNAILEGRKTQTRRIIKPQPDFGRRYNPTSWVVNAAWQAGEVGVKCPYGKTGDQIWVRETFCLESNLGIESESTYPPPFNDGRPLRRTLGDDEHYWEQPHYRATDPEPELAYDDMEDPGVRWKPSIHMPRWASRINLEITDIRVERVQEISEGDAEAEGIETNTPGIKDGEWFHYGRGLDDFPAYSAKESFESLWDSINAKRDKGAYAWAANPWVWVIEFNRIPRAGGEYTNITDYKESGAIK